MKYHIYINGEPVRDGDFETKKAAQKAVRSLVDTVGGSDGWPARISDYEIRRVGDSTRRKNPAAPKKKKPLAGEKTWNDGTRIYHDGRDWILTINGKEHFRYGTLAAVNHVRQVWLRDHGNERKKNPVSKAGPKQAPQYRVVAVKAGKPVAWWTGKVFDTDKVMAKRYAREVDARAVAGNLADMVDSPYRMAVETIKGFSVSQGRRPNPVPPSSAARDSKKRAAHLYERFTGHQANPVPEVLDTGENDVYINIGRADAVEYTTTRDGREESYRHEFRPLSRPRLIVASDGKSARIVGGRFRFTERGFVDHDADDNPRE